MYERSYGSKVDVGPVIVEDNSGKQLVAIAPDTRYRSAAEIAKLIRADIKAAIKAGKLITGIATAKGLRKVTYSVTCENYSGGRSISVTVKGLGDEFIYSNEENEYGQKLYTADAEALLAAVKAIHWAYNWDGSNSQIDYFDRNYYGNVDLQDDRDAAFEAKNKAENKAKKALKGHAYKIRRDTARAGYKAGIVEVDGKPVGRIVTKNTYGAPYFAHPAGGGVTEVRASQAEAVLALIHAAGVEES